MSRTMAAAAHGRAPDGTVDRSVLIEAMALSNDACFDVAAHARRGPFGGTAPDRGRVRVDLGGLSPSGVEKVDVATVAPDELEPTTSAAHAHVAELEGAKTLAIALRGTEEGDEAFASQGGTADGGRTFGWDAHAAAHAPLVVAGLQDAADPSHGIERILPTGHGPGGVVAEPLTRALVAPSPLADVARTTTFGQPGSRREGQHAAIFDVVHSDDFGPFYTFPDVTGAGRDARTLRDELLEQVGVAVVSGTRFGIFGEGYLRFSYAASTEAIQEACARIRAHLGRNRWGRAWSRVFRW